MQTMTIVMGVTLLLMGAVCDNDGELTSDWDNDDLDWA